MYSMHSCVVAVRIGGALPTVTALTAKGMTIMRLFVVQVIVGTTHGATQHSVNKQRNNIFESHTFRRQKVSVVLTAHKSCFLEENKLSFHFAFYLPFFFS